MKARHTNNSVEILRVGGTLLLMCLSQPAVTADSEYPPPPGPYRGDAGTADELSVPAGTSMYPARNAEVPPAVTPGAGMLPLPETFSAAEDEPYGAANLFGSIKPTGPGGVPATGSADPRPSAFAPAMDDPGQKAPPDVAVPDSRSVTTKADGYPVDTFRGHAPQQESFSGYPQTPDVYPAYGNRAFVPSGPAYPTYYPAPQAAYPRSSTAGAPTWRNPADSPATPYGYPGALPEPTSLPQVQPMQAYQATPGTGSSATAPAETPGDYFRPTD